MNSNQLRPRTVKIISQLLKPLVEEGVIYVAEEEIIHSNLKHLSEKGELFPIITPKLVTQEEAANMLSIGLSNFKKLEKENYFPFTRRMVGTSVRYRNLDILKFILSKEKDEQEKAGQ